MRRTTARSSSVGLCFLLSTMQLLAHRSALTETATGRSQLHPPAANQPGAGMSGYQGPSHPQSPPGGGMPALSPNGAASPPPGGPPSGRPKRVYAANQTQAYYNDNAAGAGQGSGFAPGHGPSQSLSGALFSPGEVGQTPNQPPSAYAQHGAYQQVHQPQQQYPTGNDGGHGGAAPQPYGGQGDGVSGMAQQFQGMGLGSRPVRRTEKSERRRR